MEDYPSNSHKSRELPEKKPGKAVTGEIITRKNSGIRRFAAALVAGGAESVRDYVFGEIVVPRARDMAYEIVESFCDNAKKAVSALLYGKSGKPKPNATTVSYRSYYDGGRDCERETPRTRRDVFRYEDIIFVSRGDAENVLSELRVWLDCYKVVSVADFYALIGRDEETEHTDNNYGWVNLDGDKARVIPVHGGYKLRLPGAIPLD